MRGTAATGAGAPESRRTRAGGSVYHAPMIQTPRTIALAALMAVALPACATAQAPDPFDVLDRAAERYRSAGSLCADFHQELTVPLLDQRKEGRGELCQARPDRFAMRFSEPEGDVVLVDGDHLWVYYPSQDRTQVIRAPVALSTGGSGLDFHREFLENPRQKYEARWEGTEEIGGVATDRVVLTPREKARYRKAEVWIGRERSLVRRVQIHDENGSVRTVHLSDIRLDPSIPAGTFAFTPPAGTQVITRDGGAR